MHLINTIKLYGVCLYMFCRYASVSLLLCICLLFVVLFNVFKKQSMDRKWFPIILSICLHYLVGAHWKFTERDSLRGIYIATYQNLRRPFKPLYCDLQENKKTLSLLLVLQKTIYIPPIRRKTRNNKSITKSYM